MPEHPDISELSDEQLLELRFCELGLSIDGTWLEQCIAKLDRELAERGIQFRPAFYLADEWLCPDGEPIVGIAFYLAHPRLMRLEMTMMLEVEGGDEHACMKLLRHETGHALNYAYLLHRRRRWRELFGSFTEEYVDVYRYRPYSKRFVRNLDECYAQCHPDEDFAETFAVWLDPQSDWREAYAGWPALEKLKYVEKLVRSITAKPPVNPKGKRHWDVSRMRSTLRRHYKQKRAFYAEYYPDFHDAHLKRIFDDNASDQVRIRAYVFLRRYRRRILDEVARSTRERKYVTDRLLRDLIARSKELGLWRTPNEQDDILKITAYVTACTANYLHTGQFGAER